MRFLVHKNREMQALRAKFGFFSSIPVFLLLFLLKSAVILGKNAFWPLLALLNAFFDAVECKLRDEKSLKNLEKPVRLG